MILLRFAYHHRCRQMFFLFFHPTIQERYWSFQFPSRFDLWCICSDRLMEIPMTFRVSRHHKDEIRYGFPTHARWRKLSSNLEFDFCYLGNKPTNRNCLLVQASLKLELHYPVVHQAHHHRLKPRQLFYPAKVCLLPELVITPCYYLILAAGKE